jgi:DNA-binding protein H-NS
MELSMITAAVSKEVAMTVKELLEQHREQDMARLQAALQTAQQAAQAAQQAAQQAAAQTAEHKAEIHQLKEEVAAVKAKMAAMKQAGAPRPGEPHPPPKWQPDTELPLSRQDKLLSSLVQELRGGVAEGKAAQSELAGKLGNVAGKLDQVTTRLSFLEQQRRLRTDSAAKDPAGH